jgi:AraC-like DNA-binding protein
VLKLFSHAVSHSTPDIHLYCPKYILENTRDPHDLPRLLHTPEHASQAAWTSIHALSLWRAKCISNWAESRWQRMPAQALADLKGCDRLASKLIRTLHADESEATECPRNDHGGWNEPAIKSPLHRAAFEFCESITTCPSPQSQALSLAQVRERGVDGVKTNARQKPVISLRYLNDLQSLLTMHQCLLRGRPTLLTAKLAVINVMSSDQFPDLQALAMFISGTQYHLVGDHDKACHAWQMANEVASSQGWTLLEVAADANLRGVPLIQSFQDQAPDDECWRHAFTSGAPQKRGSREQRLSAVKKYIKIHWQEKLTSDRLAKVSGISIRTLEADFQVMEGMTLHTYFLKEKMARARPLVLSTSLSLTEIANKCGFKSILGFNLAYTKAHGICPTDDRSKHNSRQIDNI